MDILFTLLGGFGLFLYGMEQMSIGLQQLAGAKLKGFLRTLTYNRFVGVFSGTLATAIVQSSSVTTVIIVSFVNSGLMALPQAISVILGAHIGTTITAQTIAFRIQNLALPILAGGAILHLFGRSDMTKNAGAALFGFGSLFFGLHLMTAAFDPLKDNVIFHNLLAMFGSSPIIGVVIGAGITVLLQSSSVTTGLTVALALSGLITFEQAVPLILGENIGTTVTANIAAIGGSYTAKQAARAHFIINAIGAIIALILLRPFMDLVLLLSNPTDTARQIANSHTLFNVLTTLLFFPFITAVAKLTEFFIFAKKKEEELYYLESTSLAEPGIALDQVRQALGEIGGFTLQFLKLTVLAIVKSRGRDIAVMNQIDQKVERYHSRVTEYLEKIAAKNLSQAQSKYIPSFVRILHEIERVRDYEEKIKEVALHLQSEGRAFRPTEKRELKEFFKDVTYLLAKTILLIKSENNKGAEQIIGIYESLKARKEELRKKSQMRFSTHRTPIALANYYYDIISSLEEIAKKCRNIAIALLE